MRAIRLLLWFAAATAIAVSGALYFKDRMARTPASDEQQQRTAEEIAREIVTGEFSLVDGHGRHVTDADFRGSWLLVFFGFTHCPDVCPTTLGTIALVMDQLGDNADAVQPLFITVDPARDTPNVVAEYVAAFHPKIIGLTGSAAEIAAAAKSYRAYFAKVPVSGEGRPESNDYTMDHSAHIYLMDPDGVYATVFSQTDTVDTMVRTIRERISRE